MSHDSINLTDEANMQAAQTLAEKYIAEFGIGRGAAVSILITEVLLVTILHAESPMVEVNIKAVRDVLRELTQNVQSHERCAKKLNRVKKERVH